VPKARGDRKKERRQMTRGSCQIHTEIDAPRRGAHALLEETSCDCSHGDLLCEDYTSSHVDASARSVTAMRLSARSEAFGGFSLGRPFCFPLGRSSSDRHDRDTPNSWLCLRTVANPLCMELHKLAM
jgi:hypothetical protein